MSSLLLPPMPEEYVLGYWGRMRQVDGSSSAKCFLDSLPKSEHCSGRDKSFASRLASISGLSLMSFLERHTLLPLAHGFLADYQGILKDWRSLSESFLSAHALRSIRVNQFFCPMCAEEDKRFHGFSYWRREHQLPGLNWCTLHLEPLRYAHRDAALELEPLRLRGSAVPGKLVGLSMASPAVQRAYGIMMGLLQSTSTRCVEQVIGAMRPMAAKSGLDLEVSLMGRYEMAELVYESYPHQWLLAAFSAEHVLGVCKLFSKENGGLVVADRPSKLWMLVLVAAAIYGSVDDALNAWLGKASKAGKRSARGRKMRAPLA